MSKKGQKMSLAAFHQDTEFGCSWADDVEELPIAPAAATLSYGYNTKEPSRPTDGHAQHSATRNPPRPPSKELPSHPPFLIFIGNLSFDSKPQEIDFLFKDQDLEEIKLITDANGRSKGFGYITFRSLDSLKQALEFDGELLNGRHIRIDIADPPQSRDNRTAFGGQQNRISESDSVSDWRSKSSSGTSVFGGNNQNLQQNSFGFGANQNQERPSGPFGSNRSRHLDYSNQAPTTERKRLVLLPRTAPEKVLDIKPIDAPKKETIKASPIPQDSSVTLTFEEESKPKPNPFGAAKPRDEAEIQRLFEQRQKEKEIKRLEEAEAQRKIQAEQKEKLELEKVAAVVNPAVIIPEKRIERKTVADTVDNWRERPAKSTTTSVPATTFNHKYSESNSSSGRSSDLKPNAAFARRENTTSDTLSKKERAPIQLKKEVVQVARVNAFDMLKTAEEV